MSRAPRAIVFAYHDVGVRCLQVLLDAGVDIGLVVTHADAPGETVWFASVAALAAERGLCCVAPTDPHGADLLARARALDPDFVFSFYYRQLLRQDWLGMARRGAYNMHGSLLPRYRGRAPVNWAILHGERETGATLHRMNEKPDNGAIVDQLAVPILSHDTAREVFAKVTLAAEIVLARSLPALCGGTAREWPQDLSQGGYFGGRSPEDGQIPADATAQQVHDLVRALAPPYPCAFMEVQGQRILIERTALHGPPPPRHGARGLGLWRHGVDIWLSTADGGALRVLAARRARDGVVLTAHDIDPLPSGQGHHAT